MYLKPNIFTIDYQLRHHVGWGPENILKKFRRMYTALLLDLGLGAHKLAAKNPNIRGTPSQLGYWSRQLHA